MTRSPLFDPGESGQPPPSSTHDLTRLHVLVTLRAVPHLSGRYGDSGYAAGLSTDPARPGWLRLVDAWDPAGGHPLRAYDIVTLLARPDASAGRRDSWRPAMGTLRPEHHLKRWRDRRRWLDPYVEDSMCRLDRDARRRPGTPPLALVRAGHVDGLEVVPHPLWTPAERTGTGGSGDVAPGGARPRAPRFRGAYRFRCHEDRCPGHRQSILDWEFVALQLHLAELPAARLRRALESTFLRRLCGPDRETAFYVGNQGNAFSVLGVYWPPKS